MVLGMEEGWERLRKGTAKQGSAGPDASFIFSISLQILQIIFNVCLESSLDKLYRYLTRNSLVTEVRY